MERETRALIIDVGGLGYRVFVGGAALMNVEEGAEVSFRIYQHVNDSGATLFGFTDKKEQEYFQLLLSVPSVGPSTARNILDLAPPHTLEQAVAEEDVALLTRVPGVGKRTAERIIVELKEKLEAPTGDRSASGNLQHETIEALVSIGFTSTQARQAAQDLPKDIETVEEAVKQALRSVSKA